MSIDDQVKRRIESDYAYQSERLRNLFRAIYADPVQAWEKWEAYVQAHGFPKAELRFHRKPGRFGRQKGWLIMNFLPTRSYQQREMAKREAGRMIGQWGASHLQLGRRRSERSGKRRGYSSVGGGFGGLLSMAPVTEAEGAFLSAFA